MRKWVYRFLIAICILVMAALPRAVPAQRANAQGPTVYFPLIWKGEPQRIDDFEDTDPPWSVYYPKNDPTDGRFEHDHGVLVGKVRDNSAFVIASPGWRPLGDFQLEVDARFSYDGDQYVNTLGVVFGGNDDWSEWYGFLLSNGGDSIENRPGWAVVRWDHGDLDYLEDFDRAQKFVAGGNHWNHLRVIRRQDTIYVYINGRRLDADNPDDKYIDSHYGTNRQVGVIIGSWELNRGESEFDNFHLTPQSMPY
jgi:hypothetical protein